MYPDSCNCPTDGLSDFDRGMLAAFTDGALNEMPDTIVLLGITLNCTVMDRTLSQRNIQAGKSAEVTATIEVTKADFIAAGGNMNGGDRVTFSDGVTGKISTVDDADGPTCTLSIGPKLDGSAGPSRGLW